MSSDRYEIRGKIGAGGVGAVYRAYDTQLRREVAIKRVLPDGDMNSEDATANLLKEATALSSVQHPHIVTVYDAGIDAEGPYVVMELINGKTLDEMVERGTLTFEDFKEVAIQSQEAMIAAQDLNLVHRDLKPTNVMVSWLPSGRFQVKIVDFGLAKFSAKPSLQTIDHGDAVFGSIFFMAPEQFERTPLDCRTDMYSLGAMYYYSLTGEYPFNGDTAPQVMAAHLQNKITPLIEVRPDLPPWVCDWVMWHVRRDMQDRPDSARAALEHFLAHDSAHTFGITAAHQLAAAGPPHQAPTGQVMTAGGAAQNPLSGGTAPQPIISPSGQINPHTASQRLITGATTGALNAPATQQPVVQAQPAAPAMMATQQPVAQHPSAQVQQGTTQPGQQPQMQNSITPLPKARMSPAMLAVIAGIILTLIAIIAYAIVGKRSEGDATGRVNALTQQIDQNNQAKRIPITKKDTELLLNVVAGTIKHPDEDGVKAVLITAESSDGSYNVDEMIAKFATDDSTLANGTRNIIFSQILKTRSIILGNRSKAYDVIIPWLEADPSHASAVAALDAISRYPNDESDFTMLLSSVSKSDDSGYNDKLAIVLGGLVAKSQPPGKLVQQVGQVLDGTKDPDKQRILMRIAANAGTKDALAIINKGLSSTNDIVVNHALKALAKWPNADAISIIIAKVRATDSTGNGANLRKSGIKSAMRILTSEKMIDKPECSKLWGELVELPTGDNERYDIINHLGAVNKAWAIGLLQGLQNSARKPSVKERAQKAIDSIESALEE